eukprot:TRINITY_DN865_c3_g1_i3.p1 TRINITY_DN865_c3_g1~~TRINITY_DN865_c3_g1_i3.p1  ORF type:complete len:502 (-),score=139.29 TRINITY_DN865_c3_g1_i3:1503-3008(-)
MTAPHAATSSSLQAMDHETSFTDIAHVQHESPRVVERSRANVLRSLFDPDDRQPPPPPRKRVVWSRVPTDSELVLLRAALVANAVCLVVGMLLCYTNAIITVSAPITTFIACHFRRLAPDLHRFYFYTVALLGASATVAGVVGFSASFWLYPEVVKSLRLWAIIVLPATYPFFIVFFVVLDSSQPVQRHSKISRRKVVNTSELDATITCYINPDLIMRQQLSRDYGLDPHTLSCCLDPNELARVEFMRDHAAIVVKLPQLCRAEDNYYFKVDSAGLFLFADKLIIVLRELFPLFEGHLFRSVRTLEDVALRIVYRSVFMFEEHLRLIHLCSENLERDMMRSTSNAALIRLFTLEKSLIYYRNAIEFNGHVIGQLRESGQKQQQRPAFTGAQRALLDDMLIENLQCRKMAKIYAQVLLHMAGLSAALADYNLTVITKNFTALTIAVSIPTCLTAVFGMSEFSVLIGLQNWWYLGYGSFLIAIAVIAALIFLIVRESKWLTYH